MGKRTGRKKNNDDESKQVVVSQPPSKRGRRDIVPPLVDEPVLGVASTSRGDTRQPRIPWLDDRDETERVPQAEQGSPEHVVPVAAPQQEAPRQVVVSKAAKKHSRRSIVPPLVHEPELGVASSSRAIVRQPQMPWLDDQEEAEHVPQAEQGNLDMASPQLEEPIQVVAPLRRRKRGRRDDLVPNLVAWVEERQRAALARAAQHRQRRQEEEALAALVVRPVNPEIVAASQPVNRDHPIAALELHEPEQPIAAPELDNPEHPIAVPELANPDPMTNPEIPLEGGTNFNDLNVHCVMYILCKFSLQQRFRMREVCRFWKSTIEWHCREKGRLNLYVFSRDRKPIFPLSRAHLFYTDNLNEYLREQENADDTLSFSGRWVHCLPKYFQTLAQLTIHYHCAQSDQNVARLCTFLRCAGPKLDTFSLWMNSVYITNDALMPRICEQIRAHFDQISQLNLYTDNFFVRNKAKPKDRYDIHAVGQFKSHGPLHLGDKVLQNVERFSLDCHTENHGELLAGLGSQLRMLSIDCYYLNMLNFASLLATDNPDWTRTVTRLRFRSMKEPSALAALLQRHFMNIECLEMAFAFNLPMAYFDEDIMRKLMPLTRLTELKLFDFLIDVSIGKDYTLPQVLRLTLCTKTLLLDQDVREFCTQLAAYFPNLEDLTIVCFCRDAEQVRAAMNDNVGRFRRLRNRNFYYHL